MISTIFKKNKHIFLENVVITGSYYEYVLHPELSITPGSGFLAMARTDRTTERRTLRFYDWIGPVGRFSEYHFLMVLVQIWDHFRIVMWQKYSVVIPIITEKWKHILRCRWCGSAKVVLDSQQVVEGEMLVARWLITHDQLQHLASNTGGVCSGSTRGCDCWC